MTTELILNMDDYLPLRDVVFNTLRRAILKGELKPGERLMEIKLANRLGVSRTPIREAIRKLELEGLVIMVPRKGAQVAQITAKDLNDVLEVRSGLENLAIKIACERITDQQIQVLEKASRHFENTMETDDITALAKADVDFHDIIYQATNNQRLIQILSNLREQMFRYRVEYLKDATMRATLVEEHDAICDALRNRDQQKAFDYVSLHIDNQQKAIMQSLEMQGENE